MTITAVINPVVPLNLLFPHQRVICPQSRQSAKYRIVNHNFTNDDLTNGNSLSYHCSLSEFNTAITTGSFKTKSRQPIEHVTLANRWNISKDRARQKIDKTTQRGVRTVLHPYLSCRYPFNDKGLRYDQTNHPLFNDTLIPGTTSKRGNKYAQFYGTSFGWTSANLMKLKSVAHNTLSVLFKRDGVSPDMVMDGSKEQNISNFH